MFVSNASDYLRFRLVRTLVSYGRKKVDKIGPRSLECFECSDFPREDYSEDEEQVQIF
jgi:hypothetical protein